MTNFWKNLCVQSGFLSVFAIDLMQGETEQVFEALPKSQLPEACLIEEIDFAPENDQVEEVLEINNLTPITITNEQESKAA